ncbi:MAG: hypothetical protein O3C45_01210 [Bacteroidetes bacterium]|nr:hypothetical protein [Bacteroidota bacterium]
MRLDSEDVLVTCAREFRFCSTSSIGHAIRMDGVVRTTQGQVVLVDKDCAFRVRTGNHNNGVSRIGLQDRMCYRRTRIEVVQTSLSSMGKPTGKSLLPAAET